MRDSTERGQMVAQLSGALAELKRSCALSGGEVGAEEDPLNSLSRASAHTPLRPASPPPIPTDPREVTGWERKLCQDFSWLSIRVKPIFFYLVSTGSCWGVIWAASSYERSSVL